MEPPIFGSCLLWPNGWKDQDDTFGTVVGLGPGHIVLDGDPAPFPPQNSVQSPLPIFGPSLLCMAKWLDASIKMSLGMEVGLSPGDFVLYGDPASYTKRGGAAPIFGPCLLWQNGCMDQDTTWYVGRPPPIRDIVFDVDPATPRKKAHPLPPNFWPMSLVAKRLDG